MNLDGQPCAGHSDGVVNTILIVDDKLLGKTIDDFTAGWKLNCASRIDRAAHIVGANFAVAAGYGDYRLAVKAHDMRAGEIDSYFLSLQATHSFRVFDGSLNCLDGGVRIDNHAF